MKKIFVIIIASVTLFSCQKKVTDEYPKNLIQYVDPIIGTGGHGHTYPGATSPFGMVQLSPDTRLEGWDGCSGYHYSDTMIYGFSHTHLSGTGVSDYGDLLLMPMHGEVHYKNTEYASSFLHSNEQAEAGYYRVKLDKYNILAELTTTTRTGMHRYTFPQKTQNSLLLDLRHRDIVLDSYLEKVNDSTLRGFRISKAWASEQHIYFYIQLSGKIAKFESLTEGKLLSQKSISSKDIVASISFDTLTNKTLIVKVGISAVDMEGAQKNLEKENRTWDFDEVRKETQEKWEKELHKIEVVDKDEARKTIFYTALYHTLIVPNLFSDVDGRYRGMDMKIHHSERDQYTVFSLWDTYRATHPLYTLIETKRTGDFIHTFKNQFQDGGVLPIWELAGNYTGCMIGYHSVPVIVDAYLKGLTDIPLDTLMKMILTSAGEDKLGLKAYKENGYISISDDAESVSKTLEYAYDDWCIAQMAKKAGKEDIYKKFIQRAQSYKNILDPETGNMRPKLNQIWKTPFDPSEVDFNFTEANSWQYSFYVPQDIYTFMEMIGGSESFEKQLDKLFTSSTETTGREQSDISGMIGQYAHGNEPSHHIEYLYTYVNAAKKTQQYVQQTMDELYSNQADGYCGNEDCGQMSAWYVFSAMGFYPVNPANGEYVFGKPLFDKVKINFESGKSFTIVKNGEGFVHKMTLNGNDYTKAYIKHSELVKGGNLVFEMSKEKVIQYTAKDMPSSKIQENIILETPSIRSGKRVFRDSTILVLETVEGAKLMYSINDSEEKEYKKPIVLKEITTLKMRAIKGNSTSKEVSASFYKIPKGRYVKVKNKWQAQYSAGGEDALIDGLVGGDNFRNGSWQGYYFEDLEAVIDLGEKQKLTKVSANFIQDARSWIWMPEYVEYWGSVDSTYFFPLGKVKNNVSKQDYKITIKTFQTQFYPKELRYIKVFARNHNICPDNHLGAGGKAYIFVDEVIVE